MNSTGIEKFLTDRGILICKFPALPSITLGPLCATLAAPLMAKQPPQDNVRDFSGVLNDQPASPQPPRVSRTNNMCLSHWLSSCCTNPSIRSSALISKRGCCDAILYMMGKWTFQYATNLSFPNRPLSSLYYHHDWCPFYQYILRILPKEGKMIMWTSFSGK